MSNENASLLNRIGPSQIEDLINENRLRALGCKIFYIVDTYDVIEYCFPLIFNDLSSSFSIEAIYNNFISYDYLFNKYEHKAIILDEYKIELLSIKNEVFRKIHRRHKVLDRIRTFTDNINNYQKLEKEAEINFIKNNLGALLALSLGVLDESPLQRYRKIITSRLQINNFETELAEDKTKIEKIFEDTRKPGFVNEIFEEFCEQIAMRLLSMESDNDRFIYLENAYRDILVISRIIAINKRMQKTEFKHKYLFLYLSSTPFKSEKIFGLPSLKKRLPKFENKKLTLLRNSSQIYLQQLIYGVFDEGATNVHAEAGKMLSKCQEISIYYQNLKAKTVALEKQDIDSDFIAFFQDQIKTSRKEIEKSFLVYQTFFKYEKELNEALKKLENENEAKLFRRLIEETIDLKKKFDLTNFDLPELNLERQKQTYLVYNKLFDVLSSILINKKLVIRPGLDVIRSNFQHLPILLFYKSNLGNDWNNLLQTVFNYCTNPNKNAELVKSTFISRYSNFFKSLRNVSAEKLNTIRDNILMLFLNLIAPVPEGSAYHNNNTKSEQAIIESLNDLLTITKKALIGPFVIEGKNSSSLSYRKKSNEYEKEILYLLLWLYRRQNQNYEALKIGESFVKTYGLSDPRIFQGFALTYINLGYSASSAREKEDHFHLAKTHLENARKYYLKEIDEARPLNTELILKTICALENTLTDTLVQLYALTGDRSLLVTARSKYLKILKERLSDLDLDFNEFPAFNHTEADLEYFEAEYLHKIEKKTKEAHYKISMALDRIQYAHSSDLLMELDILDESIKRIVDLKKKIASSLNDI